MSKKKNLMEKIVVLLLAVAPVVLRNPSSMWLVGEPKIPEHYKK